LLDYARYQFDLNARQPDGSPKRAHLESAASQGDAVSAAILAGGPELPDLAAYLWQWFIELSRRRTAGFVENPIIYESVLAWSVLTHRVLARWELDAILRLDDALSEQRVKDAKLNKATK